MKKFFFISFEIFFTLTMALIVVFLAFGVHSLILSNIPLKLSAITNTKLSIDIYNSQGLKLKEDNAFNVSTIDIELLPEHTKQAFISIEDKNFYKHKGINLTRIAKAFWDNLISFNIKEGASTITQQLIKNTHLSSERTISRKLNEIKLALELEKKLSKNDILENYLNIIYFGNNCYGIENASQYYFTKSASQLNVNESAILAGLIKSPNYYSPLKQPERCIKRRNLVLKEMENDKIITKPTYFNEISKPLNLNINNNQKNKLNSYSQCVIDEAVSVLKMPERQIAIGEFKIYSYQDLDKQLKLQQSIKSSEIDCDYSVIDINSKNGGIEAYLGKSDYKILENKRQIGSIIKPILVYAPAFDENILTPASLILDEPITIQNYSPKNVTGTYAGYVDTRTAISKSLNIPAVKTASYVGLNKINKYANKLNLKLDELDQSYAMALGGLTYGYNLKDITASYSVFANNGIFNQPKFINYITTKNDKIIYKNPEIQSQIFREDTAYLMTDILKTCAKSGTAKKLSDLNIPVGSKTGTVGTKSGNTDAYNISFTTEDIIGVWFGNMNNNYITTAGGNQPTALAKKYLSRLYENHKPENFRKPSSIEELQIDLSELENNHNLIKANSFTPERYKKTEIFSRFNLPKDNDNFNLTSPILYGYVENNHSYLTFNALNYLKYELYKEANGKKTLLKEIASENGKIDFIDIILSKQKVNYYILTSPNTKINNDEKIKSNILTLFNNNETGILKEKWYI